MRFGRHGIRAAAAAMVLSAAFGCSGGSGTSSTMALPQIALAKVAGGEVQPVHITHAGDGSGRLFVVEQRGVIRIIKNGAQLPSPFLDITGRVLSGGEQGLLSVAFPPHFAAKRYFYVNYTRIPDGATIVSRFRLASTPDGADPASEEIVLTISQPFANHNGGQLAFGPDGYLYIGMGDGGGGGDPQNNAQTPGTLLGKLLRIDVESGLVPYRVPSDNPFLGSPGYRGEIWALGLRNPWRFSFDRVTGDLYIADVGQGSYEEIDFQPASSPGGENYGWNVMEGAHCYNNPGCVMTGRVLPVTEYEHVQGCSITGGAVYRGPSMPALRGTYLYGDFCSGRLWGLRKNGTLWENTLLVDTPYAISTFGEDEAGNVYLADYTNGDIYLIASQ